MSAPALPPSGQYIAQTRATCRAVREAANIKIDIDALDKQLTTIEQATFDRLKHQHGVFFPLNFTSVEDEINFLAVLSLLNTLSGYRAPLHKATGQGAYQNVVKLLFAMYISPMEGGESLLSAAGLSRLSVETVEGIWGVSTYTEKAHESLPGVTVGERAGDIYDVVQLVVGVCNETGKVLVDAGYKSLGEFVLQVLKEAEKIVEERGDVAGADYIVEKIVTLIPGFRDMSTVLDKPVYIFKKVFFLIFGIYQRLSLRPEGSTAVPRLPDPAVLPMFVDNVLPTMCLYLGFIDATESTVPALREWARQSAEFKLMLQEKGVEGVPKEKKVTEGPRLTCEEAYVVRAAALDVGRVAMERVAELSERQGLQWLKGMSEADLDGYLWSVAKDDPALRLVPRMVERDTIMY